MANEPTITIIGNLTGDPELRFTTSGHAVCNFTVASTPRTYDKQAGEWQDGTPLFIRASLWQEAAENAAESLTKGMRVIAHGKLVARSYETKDGRKGTSYELEGAEVGPSLHFATAQVTRKPPRQSQQVGTQPAPTAAAAAESDPWGAGSTNTNAWG